MESGNMATPPKAAPSSVPLPAPGTAPTAGTGRLVGRFAQCSIGGSTGTVLLIFDWEFNVTTDFADGTAHGDYWEQPVQLRHGWTFRGRGYVARGGAGLAASGWSATDVAALAILAYSDNTPSHTVISGNAFAARGNFSAPMAMVTQEIELRGVGAPTLG